jgi:ABC-type antimicrobial peptide transport system permease subunit
VETEIGLRMALGASRLAVMRLVLGQALRLAGMGLLLGTAGSLGLGRVLSSLLFGVGARDPAILTGVCAILGGAALGASDLPARRAAGVDPLAALRAEQEPPWIP